MNCRAVLLKRVQILEDELNICKPSKERVRMCKDYVIGWEITTILKIAMDNIILELCDSCFLVVCDQTQTSTQLTLNHAACDVYLPKAVETLIHGQCYGYWFLYCVDSNGILNALKRSCLLCQKRRSFNLLAILRVFLAGLGT